MDLVEPYKDLAQSVSAVSGRVLRRHSLTLTYADMQDLFEYVVNIGPLNPKQCAQVTLYPCYIYSSVFLVVWVPLRSLLTMIVVRLQLVYQTADAIKYLNNFENAMHRDLKVNRETG